MSLHIWAISSGGRGESILMNEYSLCGLMTLSVATRSSKSWSEGHRTTSLYRSFSRSTQDNIVRFASKKKMYLTGLWRWKCSGRRLGQCRRRKDLLVIKWVLSIDGCVPAHVTWDEDNGRNEREKISDDMLGLEQRKAKPLLALFISSCPIPRKLQVPDQHLTATRINKRPLSKFLFSWKWQHFG